MSRRRDPRSIIPVVIIAAGAILLLATALWLLNPFGALDQGASSSASGAIPYPEIPRVNLGDAKAAYETGTAVFIDVRGEPFYSEGHIPGALSIPVADLTNHLDELDRSRWIITYCT